MAAAVSDMDDSSSSDDEALRRCREAVWDCPATQTQDTKDKEKSSKRFVVANHEHDGNELQVTQGFQTHVAKKLGVMLDSLISDKRPSIRPSVKATDNKDDEDEGFRLFSTSVPGMKIEEPPPPKRRLPSSSDSDSEMESRFKEAAVSISDIIASSSVVLQTIATVPENSSLETKEKLKKKKKKKRKLDPEENGQQNSQPVNNNQSNIFNQDEDQVVKHKKKKKKMTPS